MKKRLLSGSFALFLLALLSPSWSQQQTRSRGARSLLSTPCKGKKWQSSKGPHEHAHGSAGFLSDLVLLPSLHSAHAWCHSSLLIPNCPNAESQSAAGKPGQFRVPWSREDCWENRGHREALLVTFSFTTSHIVTYVYRPRAPHPFQAGSWAAH